MRRQGVGVNPSGSDQRGAKPRPGPLSMPEMKHKPRAVLACGGFDGPGDARSLSVGSKRIRSVRDTNQAAGA